MFLAEQEACKVSELDGEYIASWYFVGGEGTKTIIDNQEPELSGLRDTNPRRMCRRIRGRGKFSAIKRTQKKIACQL